MDFERFRLRRFLESLPAHELERRPEAIELGDVAAAHEGNARAVWFARAGGRLARRVPHRLQHASGTPGDGISWLSSGVRTSRRCPA